MIRIHRLPVLANSDRGASMVEYSLLVVLLALMAFAAVAVMGQELSGTYVEISDSFTNGAPN